MVAKFVFRDDISILKIQKERQKIIGWSGSIIDTFYWLKNFFSPISMHFL